MQMKQKTHGVFNEREAWWLQDVCEPTHRLHRRVNQAIRKDPAIICKCIGQKLSHQINQEERKSRNFFIIPEE